MGFELWVLLGLTASSFGAEITKRQGNQPNIMWIFADDYGYNDIGWKDSSISTPNMDELAGSGMKFTNNYVTPQCTPSRAAFMTGRYVHRTALQHSVILNDHPQCVPLEYKFLPGYLQELGYKTHGFGKWHLGYCRKECTPIYKGFDTFFGGFGGEAGYWDHITQNMYDWQNDIDLCYDGCDGVHSQDLIQNKVIEILEDPTSKDQPWFMYVAFHNTHSKAEPKPEFLELYDGLGLDEDRQGYLGLTSGMDYAIGQIVQALKDNGHYDNTIIAFSADNGGDVHEANNFPLRGTKCTLWEGGTKALSWIHSPLLTATGVECDGLMHVTDWLPTFVSIAGGTLDETTAADMDGLDQSDLILNNGPSVRKNMVYNIDREYDYGPPQYGEIGVRNEQYKLIWGVPGQVDGWGYDDADFLFTKQQYMDYVASFTQIQNTVDKRGGPYAFTPEQSSLMNTFFQIVRVTDDLLDNGLGYMKLFDLINDPNEKTDLSTSTDENVVAAKNELIAFVQDCITKYVHQTPTYNMKDPNFDNTTTVMTPGFCETTLPLPDNYNTV